MADFQTFAEVIIFAVEKALVTCVASERKRKPLLTAILCDLDCIIGQVEEK